MFENAHLCEFVPRAPVPSVEVAAVSCRVFRAPISAGVAMSFGALEHRIMLLVDVEFVDGTRATGETWVNYPSWAWRERTATIADGIAPLLIGRTFRDTAEVRELLLASLTRVARQWGAVGPIYQAISAIDQAFWIRAAETRGASLAAVLGPEVRSEIPVYGSSLGPRDVVSSAERCLELGLRAVKIKLGFGKDVDHANLAEARRVLGDDVRLFADANQAWTPTETIDMIPMLREFAVEWLEEPVQGDRPADLEEIYVSTGMPIATGENLYGAESFEPYLEQPGVILVQPDVSKVGGVTEYQRVVRAAEGTGTRVAPHLYNGAYATAVSIQLAAACPTTPWLEWDIRQNPVREPVDHLLTDVGTVRVPQGPGVGLDIDLEPLAPHLIQLVQEAQ